MGAIIPIGRLEGSAVKSESPQETKDRASTSGGLCEDKWVFLWCILLQMDAHQGRASGYG